MATDEAGTAEERLQSINKTLSTANLQLRGRIDDLGLANTALLAQLADAQENERRRISRELHDTLGQHMALLGMSLEAMGGEGNDAGEILGHMAQSQTALLRLEDALDRFSHDLRPASLDDLGLLDALRCHTESWSADTCIAVRFVACGVSGLRLSASSEAAAYRVVQEALTNVCKHAQASQVSVILKRRAGQLRIIVEDNGRGFDVNAALANTACPGMGLKGMQERALISAGRLEIESSPGQGSAVYLTLPLPSDRSRQRTATK